MEKTYRLSSSSVADYWDSATAYQLAKRKAGRILLLDGKRNRFAGIIACGLPADTCPDQTALTGIGAGNV